MAVSHDIHDSIEQHEKLSFIRTITHIQWLMLFVVAAFYAIRHEVLLDSPLLLAAMLLYIGTVCLFYYTKLLSHRLEWKLSIEIWLMIFFITLMVAYSGGVDSPLVNLYFLAIIASASTLDRASTFLQVSLICSCYLLLGSLQYSLDIFTAHYAANFLAHLLPFLLVAYLTMMLAADKGATHSKIKALTQKDPLTHLNNMKAFYDLVENEHLCAKRYNNKFSIMVIDINHLKSVNDKHGKHIGDKVIGHVAQVIKKSLRVSDYIARYGGDEFIILLRETDAKGATNISEKLKRLIQSSPLIQNNLKLTISASIGVASYPCTSDSLHELISQADRQMYKQKGLRSTDNQDPLSAGVI